MTRVSQTRRRRFRRRSRVSGWSSGLGSGSSTSGAGMATEVEAAGGAKRPHEDVPPWEARFRAPRTLWVRMADRRPERAIACSNVTGVYQVHRWQVGEPVGDAMSAFPTGKSAAWISPDGEWVVWHADRAGDEVGHFVAVP